VCFIGLDNSELIGYKVAMSGRLRGVRANIRSGVRSVFVVDTNLF
jgi:hypothetical protein